ncbi:MAG: type II toxin-antitoxin system prevent-host-death family antitoxin [Bifidobacteriaceae bacterium]|jgi:prevent-host-death family protein|nr:type II toxin-antitoxin system prevent-host-death family antitoxin [Bifidobacteriaceae bacterium]
MTQATEVGVLEARNHLSELIHRAKAGEDIVISSRRVPQVKLVPVEPDPPKGNGAAIVAIAREFRRSNPGRWRSDEEIEAYIQENRNAWD